jgi:hypothetical protein
MNPSNNAGSSNPLPATRDERLQVAEAQATVEFGVNMTAGKTGALDGLLDFLSLLGQPPLNHRSSKTPQSRSMRSVDENPANTRNQSLNRDKPIRET